MRKLSAPAVRRLGLNDEIVVIINDDKCICISVCCQVVAER